MRALPEADFLRWAEQRGLRLDPRYPQSAVLTFGTELSEARFWEVPAPPERRPYFLSSLLELLGDWRTCFVWRHMGSWPDASRIHPERINDVVEHEILRGLGLPMGTGQVVEFARDEAAKLATLLFSTTVFGWSVGEDLYVIPDDARYVLKTDHHDVVHVEFRSPSDVQRWVEEMATRGFPLPDEVPDETFKQPGWIMPRRDH